MLLKGQFAMLEITGDYEVYKRGTIIGIQKLMYLWDSIQGKQLPSQCQQAFAGTKNCSLSSNILPYYTTWNTKGSQNFETC